MKERAKQVEDVLLRKGYQATSIYSDYSELSDARKGQSGSLRYVFKDQAKANAVKQLLGSDTSGLTVLPDDKRSQMSADVQVLLFLTSVISPWRTPGSRPSAAYPLY
jgi:hypothetical protein